MQEKIKWYAILLVGIFIFALGTILSMISGVGASPLGAMYRSLSDAFKLEASVISYAYTVILIFAGWLFARTTKMALLSWLLSWIYSFLIGIIQFEIRSIGFTIDNEILKYVVMAAALLCLTSGIGLIVLSPSMKTFGSYAAESMHSKIKKVSKGSWIQIYDFVYIAVAIALMMLVLGKGWQLEIVGVGTILIVLTQGPGINFFLNFYKKFKFFQHKQ